MNRRHFLAGSIALAGQHSLLPSIAAISQNEHSAGRLVPPHNLLSTTYPESFLKSRLVSAAEWHPYPRWSERGSWEAVPADLRAAILNKAENDRKSPWDALLATNFLEYKRNGNRSRFQGVNFGRRARLHHLVLAECIEGKGRFLDDIANGVWLICEESFWGVPAHLAAQRVGVGLPDVTDPIVELFGAETAQLLAWTSYLLGPQLDQVSPLIVKRIAYEADWRIMKPARERNDFTWMGLGGLKQEHRLNNWNPWINSNLLVANLVLQNDPKLRVEDILRINRSVDAFLNDYWPDACEEEGPGYFNHSPLCVFEILTALESATGHSTNILANPFIDAMGRFTMNVHIAGDDYAGFGDVHGKASGEADVLYQGDVLFRYGKAVHDPQLEAFGAYHAAREGWTSTGPRLEKTLQVNRPIFSRSMPAILAANEIRSARREDALFRDCWYPDFGLMTARKKVGSSDGMYVAVIAANNGRSHSHNDTGNYIVYQDGEPLAVDVGVLSYTSKSFSADRYSIWTMQSAYHNLPTVGGFMQHDGLQYRATNRKYESDDNHATVSFDFAAAYPKEAGVTSWVRTVRLDRVRNVVTVNENFALEHAVPISISVMTPRVATEDQAGTLTLRLPSEDNKTGLLKFDSAQLHATVETIALTDSDMRANWGSQIYRIQLNTKQPVASGKFSYTFSPA